MEHSTIKGKQVESFLSDLFKYDVHVKRIKSISNAVLGVLNAGSLAIHLIGHGLSKAKGLVAKHAIKQVDRLLSNKKFDVWEYFETWVSYVVGCRKEVVVALDWTEFDSDDLVHHSLKFDHQPWKSYATDLENRCKIKAQRLAESA